MSAVDLRLAQRRGTSALADREVRRVLSLWTQTILPPVVTAALFLAVFGGVLGDRIREIEGVPYLEFIFPGLLVLTVASQAFANNSTSLFQAKSEGYIENVLMRQGVDTVKPDVHVRRFAEAAVGRPLSDADVVEVVTRAARLLGIRAYELDWRIWEASRGGSLPYPAASV
jgi:hypothetical protein